MAKRSTPEWIENLKKAKPRKWVIFNCDYCGNKSEDKPSHYKRKKRHFCSAVCYAKYRQELLPKHEHNAWKGGITKATQVGRGNKKYKEWKRAVLARDGKCVWCGSVEKLEADHIKRWSTHVELRLEITNGRTLCMKCHNKTRNKRFYENPELINQVMK